VAKHSCTYKSQLYYHAVINTVIIEIYDGRQQYEFVILCKYILESETTGVALEH